MLKTRRKKVIIIGAGTAGKDVAHEIEKSLDLGLKTVGFIDDSPDKQGLMVGSSPVLGTGRDLVSILKNEKIGEVIIAIPSADGAAITRYVKICSRYKVPFRIVPRVKEIIEGKAHIKTLREVRVEDLLGRPVVKADVKILHQFFEDKTVLVTGAAGSIGSELSRQIAAYRPKHLILLDWWENGLFELEQELLTSYKGLTITFVIANIQNQSRVERVFKEYLPHYVFHAAAYKHVPLMEQHPCEAVLNNVFGTFNVAKYAKKFSVERFVLVSTDKAANPISVMGATKLITEGIGKMLNGSTKFLAVRFGNVLDSYGSVIPTFKRQIAKGGPVTITDKRMMRYFMTIPEAAQLILKAGYMGDGGELFVLEMGEPVKIIELAENIIRLSGYIPYQDIKVVVTGRRPGEKLREKLLNDKELFLKTDDPKINKTESLGFSIEKLPKTLTALKSHALLGQDSLVRKDIASMIKSFKAR